MAELSEWRRERDSFFTPPFRLRNLLKTSYAKTAKHGKTAGRGHNLGTVKRLRCGMVQVIDSGMVNLAALPGMEPVFED